MSIGKSLAFFLLSSGGVFRLGRALWRRSLVILTYHRVVAKTPCGRASNSVFSSEFDDQIRYLVHRYHIATGEEVRSFVCEGGSLPRNSVLITFDDGYENNYSQAFPILQRYGATATFFLTTGLIGRAQTSLWFDELDSLLWTNSIRPVIECLKALGLPAGVKNERGVRKWIKGLARQPRENAIEALRERLPVAAHPNKRADNTKLMTWDQVREMGNAGMTFGSHTYSHQILASAKADDMEHELLSSRLKIESETSRPCWAFAYPNGESGDFDRSHKVALKAAGYSCAFTQIPGFVDATTDPYALPRIPIPDSGDIRVFASRVSGVYQWWQKRIFSNEQQRQPRY